MAKEQICLYKLSANKKELLEAKYVLLDEDIQWKIWQINRFPRVEKDNTHTHTHTPQNLNASSQILERENRNWREDKEKITNKKNSNSNTGNLKTIKIKQNTRLLKF
jgi:hypothetical protein